MTLYERLLPYFHIMRLHRPIGTLLLLWPTLWALWIAADGLPSPAILIVFLIGVILMRSAGCVINDLADRQFDGQVNRTKHRPLVTGAMSVSKAIWLFVALGVAGFLLAWQLNSLTVKLSIIGLCLAILYPFTKRVVYFPQLALGAVYAWSVPMAFAAEQGRIPGVAWLVYFIAVLWPIAYDTIYALMDREDDVKIGVKSTAILFGRWDITIILFLQMMVLSCLVWLGYLLTCHWCYFLALFIVFLLHGYQYRLLKLRTTDGYYRAFYNNHWLGCLIFLGLAVHYLLT